MADIRVSIGRPYEVWAETGNIAPIAHQFDASLSAMGWRLYSFGLLEAT